MYDTVKVGRRVGQVKLWGNNFKTYTVSDQVPRMEGFISYDIAMREGGFIHIRSRFMRTWDNSRAAGRPCFDKWGEPWVDAETNIGEVGEMLKAKGYESRYFFTPEKPS